MSGIEVTCRAVVLPGDDAAIELPAQDKVYLERTVQDIVRLSPVRPMPLIGDILRLGANGASTTHVVFSNMDISVQPRFYAALRELIAHPDVGLGVPFTVARVNIDPALATAPLESLYAAQGVPGVGYDCFVIPTRLIRELDLGSSCIGAPHFDQLLVMALDAACGHRFRHFSRAGLTFHLGNDIAWAAMLDYVEYNLAEALSAITRMRQYYNIQPGSLFDKFDQGHFRRNAKLSSALLRKLKRIPGLSQAILNAKRAIGRQY